MVDEKATPVFGWTEPLVTANLRADPSGIQDAGTEWQAILLPGMTTQTTNIRYVSLLTAARYLRQIADQEKLKGTALNDYWRRLEALVAVCSVLHHQGRDEPSSGIIGRTYADREVLKSRISLSTGLHNPPYRIYRGTLGALGLFDLGQRSDPLFMGAQPLGKAWDPANAGKVGKLMLIGNLPEVISRKELEQISGSFCLCRVPGGSSEQKELIDLLFGLRQVEEYPQFSTEGISGSGIRVASWRLLLELIKVSPSRPMWGEYLMGRVLEDDLLDLPLTSPLRQTLFIWRWIAARSFFERGWTSLFNEVFGTLREERFGLPSDDLRRLIKAEYLSLHADESLNELVEQAKRNISRGNWYVQRFQLSQPRDCLQMMAAGLLSAERDRLALKSPILGTLNESGGIPFSLEIKRLLGALDKRTNACDFWADTSIETIVHHIKIALRKMRQGNPDTLHVDFENGRWLVPTKALGWNALPSSANSRLDIALGWAEQLGLLESRDDDSIGLTRLGIRLCRTWDEFYKTWA